MADEAKTPIRQLPQLAPLPLLDDHLWAHAAALLDDSRLLGRLASVVRRFAAVAELAAALAVSWKPPHVRASLPQRCDMPAISWLQLMRQADALQYAPLRFSSHGPSVQLSPCGCVATSENGFQAAVASEGLAMHAGRHSADFTVLSQGGDSDTPAGNDIGCWVGIVGTSFDASKGVAAIHTDSEGPAPPGQDSLLNTLVCPLFGRAVGQGDIIGLEVDLDAGTLAVALNGVPRGLLLKRGLKGPVRWAADVGYTGAVRLSRPTPQGDLGRV